MSLGSAPLGGEESTTASQMMAAILADSPRAYYRLGESSGTVMVDSSGNDRHGTYQGTITQAVPGLLAGDADTAVTFGGSNNAMGYVANASWQQLPGGFSIASRIKPAFPGTPYQAIASMYDASFTNSQFAFRIEGAHLALYIFRGGSTFAASGGTVLTAGVNYTAHATWDGTTAKVYLNGVLDGSTTNAGAANTSTVNFTVGNRNTAAGAPNSGDVDSKFAGTIDELAYFAGDIGATRVAAHHTAATSTTVSGAASLSLALLTPAFVSGTGSLSLSGGGVALGPPMPGSGTGSLSLSGEGAAQPSALGSLSLSAAGAASPIGLVSTNQVAIVLAGSTTVPIPALPEHRYRDRIIVVLAGKYSVVDTPTMSDPTWILVGEGSGGVASTGGDVGSTRWFAYMHECMTDNEPVPSVTMGTNGFNTAIEASWVWRPAANKTWEDALTTSAGFVASGSDTNTASPLTATLSPWFLTPRAGDTVFAYGVFPTDSSAGTPVAAMTAGGLAGGTVSPGVRGTTANNDDCGIVENHWTGFTGAAATALTYSVATGGSNNSGSIFAIALREHAPSAAPDIPTNVMAEVGSHGIFYTWDAPSAGEFAESYEVRIDGGVPFDPAPDLQRPYQFYYQAVTPSTSYTFQIRAKNIVGVSSWVTLTPTTGSTAGYSGTPWPRGVEVPQTARVWLTPGGTQAWARLTLGGSAGARSPSAGTASLSLSGEGWATTPLAAVSGTGSLALTGLGGGKAVSSGSGGLTFTALGNWHAKGTGSLTLSFIAPVARSATGSLVLSALGSVVITVSQTITFQGAAEFTVFNEVYTFVGELRLEILNPEIDRAPSSITVTLVGAESQTNVTFSIDSTSVYTVQTNSDGTLGPTSLSLTEALGAQGAHTVTATQGTVSDTQSFIVLNPPASYPTPETPPASPVSTPVVDGTRHWAFQDPTPGGLGSYVFPHNPRQMTSPHLEHALTTKPTTSVTEGQVHIFQAGAMPKEWQFSGYCPSQAHQEAILQYRHLNRRFYIIDHRNRAWEVVLTNAEFVPRLRQVYNGVQTDWGSDFTITAVVLNQNWSTPV